MLMTLVACQKEELSQIESSSTENSETKLFDQDYQEYQDYVKLHGEVKREVTDLDDLLRYFEENNLPELSQDFINELKNRIESRIETRTSGPCNSGWINYCGDLNGNGVFSSADIAYYVQTCSNYCNSPSACDENNTSNKCGTWTLPSNIRRFGYLSHYRGDAEIPYIDLKDRNAAIDFVIGFFSC